MSCGGTPARQGRGSRSVLTYRATSGSGLCGWSRTWCPALGDPLTVGRVEPEEVRLRTGPGDCILVPPFVPHREENPDPSEEAVVVIARSTREAIVVNLPGSYALSADTG